MPEQQPGLLGAYDLSDDDKKRIALQSLFSGLTSGGIAAIAAGGNMHDYQRAPLLAQAGQALGAIPTNTQELLSAQMRQKLMGAQTAEQRQKVEEAARIDALMASPEFQASTEGMSPAQRALAKINPAAFIAAVRDHTTETNADKRFQMSEKGLTQRAEIAARAQEAQNARWDAILRSREGIAGQQIQGRQDITQQQIEARKQIEAQKDQTRNNALNPFYVPPTPQAGPGPSAAPQMQPPVQPQMMPGAPAPVPQAAPAELPPYQIPGMAPAPMAPRPQPVPIAPPQPVPLNQQQGTLMRPPMIPPQGAGDETPTEATQGVLPNWQTEESLALDKPFNRNAPTFQSLPDAYKQQVHDMAMYRREAPSTGSRSRLAGPLNAALADYTNGGYDAKNYKVLGNVLKEFSQAGVTGRSITNMDTAYGHLGMYYDFMKILDNGPSPALNAAKNVLIKQFGLPEGTNVDLVKAALGAEVAKYLAGTGQSALEDRKEWTDKFSNAASLQQAQGAINSAASLMEERSEALKNKYKSDTGGMEPRRPFLSDKNMAKLEEIRKNPLGGAPAGGGGAGIPAGAQAMLKANPSLAEAFDKKYGAGSAAKVLGR